MIALSFTANDLPLLKALVVVILAVSVLAWAEFRGDL